MKQIPRLILKFFSLRHVAHHRFDAKRRGSSSSLGASRDFDPHRGSIRAPKAQQVVVRRPVARELLQKIRPGLVVDKSIDVERTNVGGRRVFRPAEHDFQMWIGRERRRLVSPDEADIDPLVERFEQTRVRVAAESSGAVCRRG